MADETPQLPPPVSGHAAAIRSACARHSVSSLALVGSAARSDIDVLVDFLDGDINYFRAFMGLRREMAEILGRRVDLISRRGVTNPLLLASLERDAIELYPAHAA
jgi:predicted nucleotidyltransferase